MRWRTLSGRLPPVPASAPGDDFRGPVGRRVLASGPAAPRSDNNAVAFTQELLGLATELVRLGLVRADSGFAMNGSWSFGRPSNCYIVVAPAASARPKPDQPGHPLAGNHPGDGGGPRQIHQAWGWAGRGGWADPSPNQPAPGGRRPGVDRVSGLPGIQALITSLPQSVDGLRVWRRYNGRADCENIIKELANAYALPQLCLKRFYATEAALSLSVLAYNLCVLFQRHVGWEDRVTTATLRMRLFTTGGIVSRTGAI